MYSFLPQHNTKQFKNISSSDWDLVSISGQQLHSWINEVTCTVGSEKKETRRYVLTHNHMDQHQHLKVMTSDKTLQLRIPTVQIPSSALFVNIAEPAFKSPSFDKKYHVWFFVFFFQRKKSCVTVKPQGDCIKPLSVEVFTSASVHVLPVSSISSSPSWALCGRHPEAKVKPLTSWSGCDSSVGPNTCQALPVQNRPRLFLDTGWHKCSTCI